MAKATNRSLQNATRASIARLRDDAAAHDMERVHTGLYLIAESIALLKGKAQIETLEEMRATLRALDARGSAVLKATVRVALAW